MPRSVRLIGLLLVALVILWFVRSYLSYQKAELPVLARLPQFSLQQLSGQAITRDDLQGSVWALSFFFTSCPSICPAINAKLSNLSRDLASDSEIKILSISVDPKIDTPQKLADYAKSFGADQKKWIFAVGEMEQVRALARAVMLDAGDTPDLHTTRVAIVDHQGQIRALIDTVDQDAEARITKVLRAVLAEHL